jgi:dienelactone hydrolase
MDRLTWNSLVVFLVLFQQSGCDHSQQGTRPAAPPETKAHPSEVRVEIEPTRALYDKPISLKVFSLPADQPVMLRTMTVDSNRELWESVATFMAAPDGTLDISKQSSAEGSYTGVDAQGPFWSMIPNGRAIEFSVDGDFAITISVESDGVRVAHAEIERIVPLTGREIRREEIRQEGLVGDLYLPGVRGRYPALILLGGSDGEPMKARSALLAAHGFVVLNLFYFAHPSLPERFVGIPLEYFDRAASWLKDYEEVDSERLGVIGHSRGAEGALLLGTIRRDIKAIIAVAPSAVAWPGPNPKDCFRSAWSHRGRDVSFVGVDLAQGLSSLLKGAVSKEPIDERSLFEASLRNKSAVESAAIPVENTNAAILLVSGKDDRIWPAADMAEMVVNRLEDRQRPFPFRHLSYEAAGHSFGLPNLPRRDPPSDGIPPGGTRQGNALAATQSWKAMLKFLQEALVSGRESAR